MTCPRAHSHQWATLESELPGWILDTAVFPKLAVSVGKRALAEARLRGSLCQTRGPGVQGRGFSEKVNRRKERNGMEGITGELRDQGGLICSASGQP